MQWVAPSLAPIQEIEISRHSLFLLLVPACLRIDEGLLRLHVDVEVRATC
jgi:hypothetical protein